MTRERLGVKQKVKKVYANLTCQLSHGDAYSLHVMAPGDTHIKRGICACAAHMIDICIFAHASFILVNWL